MSKIFAVLTVSFFSLAQAEDLAEDFSKAAKNSASVPVPAIEMSAEQSDMSELDSFFAYFENISKTQNPQGENFYPSKSFNKAAPIYSIDLEGIKNEYLKAPITFKTSKGTTVYVSGSKASNCPDLSNKCADKEKFFMVMTTSAGETFFIRAMEVINWGILMSGSKTVSIDGEKFTVKVYAKASEPEKSRLEVKGPKGAVLDSTLDKLGTALATKGVDIKLSKSYKLAYGNEIVQTGKGNAKFTENKLIMLIPFPVVDASNYYVIKTSDIKPTGTTFPSMEPGYTFAIKGDTLEISR